MLFKGGNAFEFDNYKGITVGPILTKLFVMILDIPTLHIADSDRTKQGKKEATLLLFCGFQKGL